MLILYETCMEYSAMKEMMVTPPIRTPGDIHPVLLYEPTITTAGLNFFL